MDINQHVAERLRLRRSQLGLEIFALAAATGIPTQQIRRYEAAEARINAEDLWALACALRVGADYFYVGLPDDFDLR